MKQILCIFFCSFLFVFSPTKAEALPQLVIDPSGQAPILIPEGWNVAVSENNGVGELAVTENPNSPSSPQIGMLILPTTLGMDALACLEKLAALVSNRVDIQSINSYPLYGLILEGKVNNIDVGMTIMTTTDQATGQVIGTYFIAPKDKYEALGAEKLLIAVNQMGFNPFENGTNVSQSIDVYGYDAQVALLQAKKSSPVSWIVGEWENGVGAPTGQFRDNITGLIHNASIGRGNYFKFNADGSYIFLRSYSISDDMGDSQFTASEEGTYSFDGWNLVLKPKKFEAKIQALSGKPTEWSGGSSNERTYEVAIHPSQKGLVINGACPMYGTSSSPGCVGMQNEIMREGLLKK